MSSPPAQSAERSPMFHGPRIAAALILFAPIGIYWGMRHPQLGLPGRLGIVLIGLLCLLGQMALVLAGLALAAAEALPPWTHRLVGLYFIAVAIALSLIDAIGRRALTPVTAWAGALIVVLLTGTAYMLIARPMEYYAALTFRVQMIATAQESLEDGEIYHEAGAFMLTEPPLDLRVDEPEKYGGDWTSIRLGGCTLRLPQPVAELDRRADAVVIERPNARIGLFVERGDDRALLRGPGRPDDPAIAARIERALDFATDRDRVLAAYDTTYRDIRAARGLDDLIRAEWLYLQKVLTLPGPTVRKFESGALSGVVSLDTGRATALVFDAGGTHRMTIMVTGRTEFVDDALLAEAMREVLRGLGCPRRTQAPPDQDGI